MKKLRILLLIGLMVAPVLLFAADGEAGEKTGLIAWLSGAGITLLSAIVVWVKKNFKGLFKKIKEIIDIPLAVTTGLSKISTEIAQASGAVTNMLELMENFAQDEDMSAKELISKFKQQKDTVLNELRDIPKAVDEAAINIRKEISDLTKGKDE